MRRRSRGGFRLLSSSTPAFCNSFVLFFWLTLEIKLKQFALQIDGRREIEREKRKKCCVSSGQNVSLTGSKKCQI